MKVFLIIWGVTFLFTFITGMFDRGYEEPWLYRACRAAGYTFVFCIVIFILEKLGIGGSGDEYGETYYRR
jgi:hypothetical protein